jgi:LysM repeat protein
MRPRLLTFGILILVTAVVLVGVTGCERKAESREPVATETVEAPSSGEPSEGGQQSPMPGETIVSAVTPAGGQTSQPGTQVTSAPAGGTPVVSGPTATTAPGGSSGAPTAVPPTTAPPATSPDTGDYVWHTVQRGETAYSIAVRYGTTVNAIASANGLANPSQIYAGQKLKIPTSGSGSVPPSSGSPGGCRIRHTVQAGEWVYQIARNYGVSPQSIVTANWLANPSLITPGMVLCIP